MVGRYFAYCLKLSIAVKRYLIHFFLLERLICVALIRYLKRICIWSCIVHEGTSKGAIALPLKQESKVLRREMHHHQRATPSGNTTHNPSQNLLSTHVSSQHRDTLKRYSQCEIVYFFICIFGYDTKIF